nr:hypothetical protein B0A51_03281 [Rachicladosporium sp. CCFEE 5018]
MARRQEPFTLFDYPQQDNPDLKSCLLYKQLRTWAKAYYQGMDPRDACYVASMNQLYRDWVEDILRAQDAERNAPAIQYATDKAMEEADETLYDLKDEQSIGEYLVMAREKFNTLNRAACTLALTSPAKARCTASRLWLKGPGLQETVTTSGDLDLPRRRRVPALRSPLSQSTTTEDLEIEDSKRLVEQQGKIASPALDVAFKAVDTSYLAEKTTCMPIPPVPKIFLTPPDSPLRSTSPTHSPVLYQSIPVTPPSPPSTPGPPALESDGTGARPPENIPGIKVTTSYEHPAMGMANDTTYIVPRIADALKGGPDSYKLTPPAITRSHNIRRSSF